NYERYEERQGMQQTVTSPTALQRTGDFSQTRAQNGSPITIYDPTTTRANPASAGRFIRDAFPANVIPANRISPVARAALDYYPLPNLPGLPLTNAQNLFETSLSPITKNAFGIKTDYNLTPSRRVSFRYNWDDLDLQFP